MMHQSSLEKLLLYLVVALITIALIFTVAAIFVDDFRADASTIVTVILGALTTMTSILAGGYITKEYRNSRNEDGGNDDNGSN